MRLASTSKKGTEGSGVPSDLMLAKQIPIQCNSFTELESRSIRLFTLANDRDVCVFTYAKSGWIALRGIDHPDPSIISHQRFPSAGTEQRCASESMANGTFLTTPEPISESPQGFARTSGRGLCGTRCPLLNEVETLFQLLFRLWQDCLGNVHVTIKLVNLLRSCWLTLMSPCFVRVPKTEFHIRPCIEWTDVGAENRRTGALCSVWSRSLRASVDMKGVLCQKQT